MRIMDWSSDVCSSDLPRLALFIGPAFSPVAHCIEDVEQILAFRGQAIFVARRPLLIGVAFEHPLLFQQLEPRRDELRAEPESGRASSRERVYQYGWI